MSNTTAPAGRTERLSIFLAKPDSTEKQLIDNDKKPKQTRVTHGRKFIGTLYSIPSFPHDPAWLSLFGEAIDAKALKLQSSSAAAVLICQVADRLMAVAFGYGRHLLEPAALDETFGLRVTLNSVEEGEIRSIDRRNFDGISSNVREQTAKAAKFSDFGLDVERDLLRAVVGTPRETQWGTRMSGMDALAVTCKLSLAGLLKQLESYLHRSQDSSYKERYPWIDNISEIRDPKLSSSLWDEVCSQLQSKDFTRKWMAVPDIIDWQNVEGFKYSSALSEQPVPDLHLASYLEHCHSIKPVTLESLQRHKVRGISGQSEKPFGTWSAHRCLYAELDRDNRTYLLNDGKWYAVGVNFVKKVNDSIKAIPQSSVVPLAAKTKETEGPYNERLAAHLGAHLLDKENLVYGGGKSRIEFCDIITPAKQLLFVKRYSGSSTLSHLFAQGLVSGTTFASDAEFRDLINKVLPAEYRVSNSGNRPAGYEIAYLVVSNSKNALELPFFSRVTLRTAVARLQAQGFGVTLTKIEVDDTV